MRPARGGAKLPSARGGHRRRAAGPADLLRAGQPHRLDTARRSRRDHGRADLGLRHRPHLAEVGRARPGHRPRRASSRWQPSGIGGDYYPGRITGYLGDPNAGAYFIAVLGIIAVFFCDDRWKVRLAVAVPIVAGLVLSYSRTGLLAGAFAIVWVLLGRRLGAAGGAAMAVGLVWVVNNIPKSLTTFGPFSDRSGSDALREPDHRPGTDPDRRRTVVRPRPRHCQGQHPRPRVLLPQQLSRHPAGGRLGSAGPRAGPDGRSRSCCSAKQARAGDLAAAGARPPSSPSRSWPPRLARCCSTPPWRSRSASRSGQALTIHRDGAPDG